MAHNSLTGAQLIDHTLDANGKTYAGFLVRKFSRDLGYVWTQAGVWHWRSASGRNFGERQHKHVAIQSLIDAFAFYAAQRNLPLDGMPTTCPPKSPTNVAPGAPKREPVKDAPIVLDSRPIVWADTTVGSDLRDRIAAGFSKIGAAK